MDLFILKNSQRKDKKYVIVNQNEGKAINFGQAGALDFTLHSEKDREERKRAYRARHRSREDWGKSGIDTAGFWSRWLLWNKPTIKESISDIKKKFGVKIIDRRE